MLGYISTKFYETGIGVWVMKKAFYSFLALSKVFNDALQSGVISLSVYGYESAADVVAVKTFSIENANKTEDDYGNFRCSISCEDSKVDDVGEVIAGEHIINDHLLNVYCSRGDTQWLPNIKREIWGDSYPIALAIDENRYLYFISIGKYGLDFSLVLQFSEYEVAAINAGVDETKPYSLTLDYGAMLAVLDGSEGCNALRKSLKIRFDCGENIVSRTVNDMVEPASLQGLGI